MQIKNESILYQKFTLASVISANSYKHVTLVRLGANQRVFQTCPQICSSCSGAELLALEPAQPVRQPEAPFAIMTPLYTLERVSFHTSSISHSCHSTIKTKANPIQRLKWTSKLTLEEPLMFKRILNHFCLVA